MADIKPGRLCKMSGVSGPSLNMLGNLSGGLSQSSSTISKSVSTRAATAASKNQQDSLTILLSEVRLSMAQSLFDQDFSFSPLESLTASLNDMQAMNEAGMFQTGSDLSQSIFSSDSLSQAIESLNPAKDLLNIMEQTILAQRNPELIQSIQQSLEPNYTDAMSSDSPGSLLDLRA
jgi:hypothetical protein